MFSNQTNRYSILICAVIIKFRSVNEIKKKLIITFNIEPLCGELNLIKLLMCFRQKSVQIKFNLKLVVLRVHKRRFLKSQKKNTYIRISRVKYASGD